MNHHKLHIYVVVLGLEVVGTFIDPSLVGSIKDYLATGIGMVGNVVCRYFYDNESRTSNHPANMRRKE